MNQRTNRSRAIATQNEEIDRSVAKAQASPQGQRKSAVEMMASRLNMSNKNLVATLRSTVFKGCRTDEEFAALIVVANEYQLNPLLKEIYAFPSKGGGIVPMVSIDGWIRIMNTHPDFDGIEFGDIVDENGKVSAIEATIYHKGRTRPIKTMEYLDECYRPTEPWKMMPNRMLRHKALIQCARIAFGFSGIVTPDDEGFDDIEGGDVSANRQATRLPSREELEAEGADPGTGEVIDQEPEQADPAEEQRIAEELDARTGDDGYDEAEPDYGDDDAADSGSGDQALTGDAAESYQNVLTDIMTAQSKKDLADAEREYLKVRVTFNEQANQTLEDELSKKRKQLG